jgi:hypothetical protein
MIYEVLEILINHDVCIELQALQYSTHTIVIPRQYIVPFRLRH